MVQVIFSSRAPVLIIVLEAGRYADPGQFLAISGLDFLRSSFEGGNLPPPIGYFFGLQLSAVEPGSTTFTMPMTDWLVFPQGAVSGATLSFLVDAPLGCAFEGGTGGNRSPTQP